MRQFVKFPPNYWLSSEMHNIKQQGANVSLLALYLLTAPGSQMSGIYFLPCEIIASDLNLQSHDVSESLQLLIDLGFCFYDKRHQYIWVCDLIEMQVGDKFYGMDKRLRIIHYQLSKLPELSFLDEFYKRHKQQFFLNSQPKESYPQTHLISTSSNKIMNKKKRTYKVDGSRDLSGKKYCSYIVDGKRCPNVAVATRGVHHNSQWFCQEHAKRD